MAKVNSASTTRKSGKKKRVVKEGIAHILASFNNTLISVSDMQGNVLCQHSSGAAQFKGSRKATPFAAQVAAETLSKRLLEEFSMERVSVYVQGPGSGRDSAIRGLRAHQEVLKLTDTTPLPHNGCRPKKKRRV